MEMPEKPVGQINESADLTLTDGGNEAAAETTVVESQVAADEAVDAEAAEVASDAAESEPTEVRPHRYENAAEVLVALTEISQREPDDIARDEVSRLKQLFINLNKAEADKALKEYVDGGGDPFAYTPDEDLAKAEELMQALVEQIKEKKAVRAAQLEAEMKQNFEAKEKVLAEITQLSADADNVNRHFPRFRELQAEFKAVGEVDPRVSTDQWKRYQDVVELFYDQLKVNQELRDYDFKKNLDTKQHLCAEAESLAQETDVVTAFRRLQDLHIKWRETGPVAKELREELWMRFKEASAIVNRAYQQHFEARKQREAENEAAKEALCQKVEAIDVDQLSSFNAWNDATAQVLAAQEEWKQLGFASRKVNNALFSRFRQACDRFFEKKGNYYKTVKEDLAENLRKKIALCEEAESLKESTKWKATADRLTELQKQWRSIGAVPKKQSDAVWSRFQAACDYFFERRKSDLNSARHTEQANLKAKREIIATLKALPEDLGRDEVVAAVKDAQAQWQAIGHVPFKEKEAIYGEFRQVIDKMFAAREQRGRRSGMARFESDIDQLDDAGKISRERERLARVLEQKRADLQSYNTNMSFFTVKSSQGSSLLRDIERKKQALQADIDDLAKKIAIIDAKASGSKE